MYLSGPNVQPLVKGATGQQSAVRTERHRVDRVNVFAEGVQTCSLLHLPQLHCGVKGRPEGGWRVGGWEGGREGWMDGGREVKKGERAYVARRRGEPGLGEPGPVGLHCKV